MDTIMESNEVAQITQWTWCAATQPEALRKRFFEHVSYIVSIRLLTTAGAWWHV